MGWVAHARLKLSHPGFLFLSGFRGNLIITVISAFTEPSSDLSFFLPFFFSSDFFEEVICKLELNILYFQPYLNNLSHPPLFQEGAIKIIYLKRSII